jgi:AcrR family transcriptional regulator
VIKHGLAETTLAKVAEESGMSRGHIRHYVGNRDELILALTHWCFAGQDQDIEREVSDRFEADGLDGVLDTLFGPYFSESNDENTLILEFLRAARTDERLRGSMLGEYNRTKFAIGRALGHTYPTAIPQTIDDVAYALLCLALGNAIMSDLNRNTLSDNIVRSAGAALIATITHPSVPTRALASG